MKLKKVVIGLSFLSVSLLSIAQVGNIEEKKINVVKEEVVVFESKKNTNNLQNQAIDSKTEQIVDVVENKDGFAGKAIPSEDQRAAMLPAPSILQTTEVKKEASVEPIDLSIEDVNGSEDPIVKQEMESIKNLFVSLNEVFNKKEANKLSSFFTEKFIFIQSDQAIYKDFDSLAKYFFEKTKFEGLVDFSEIKLQEKIATSISLDGLSANLMGKASEKYLVGDSEYTLPLRWTADLEKVDGMWKIKSIHFGADHLGNQILASYESFGIKLGIVALFVGLILGMLLAGLLLRIVKK